MRCLLWSLWAIDKSEYYNQIKALTKVCFPLNEDSFRKLYFLKLHKTIKTTYPSDDMIHDHIKKLRRWVIVYLVVKGEDSQLNGCGFESWHSKLDGCKRC